MDALSKRVEDAIRLSDFTTLSSIFSTDGSGWQSLGGTGEQRTLAAHFVRQAILTTNTSFLPAAFSSHQARRVIDTALSYLPATPVENGSDNTLRWKLFEFLKVEEEDYVAAAQVLGGMRMSDMEAHEKCNVYVNIAECYLEEDETVEADSAVTKAGSVVEDILNPKEHQGLILRFKSTYARVLDANRKFLQAASRYYDISQAHEQIDADDLLSLLGMAATCAILAPSGPQRQRILGLVFKDERLSQLGTIDKFSAHSAVLTKMYMNQLLRKDELVTFTESLSDHQKAIMGDGFTFVERAVIEHNILAVGRLYNNIYFVELGQLLDVEAHKSEKVCASMIVDGKLKASIDQVDGMLTFIGEKSALIGWDDAITGMCVQLNRVADLVRVD
mmetsp:Transcript_28247/g.32496  ORF Transcript_28247/g.32496 Transcript_28247/m.32496 type:complete len:389 (-) Transcript_28247:197-1363(-)